MADITGVNMTPKEIEDWLDTDESKSVGQSDDGGESTGRKSARKIVEILRTNKSDLTDSDEEHIAKVEGYISRHKAQKPQKEEIETSKWRYSLMNWGHDPLK
jgi:hypothetical protein